MNISNSVSEICTEPLAQAGYRARCWSLNWEYPAPPPLRDCRVIGEMGRSRRWLNPGLGAIFIYFFILSHLYLCLLLRTQNWEGAQRRTRLTCVFLSLQTSEFSLSGQLSQLARDGPDAHTGIPDTPPSQATQSSWSPLLYGWWVRARRTSLSGVLTA